MKDLNYLKFLQKNRVRFEGVKCLCEIIIDFNIVQENREKKSAKIGFLHLFINL